MKRKNIMTSASTLTQKKSRSVAHHLNFDDGWVGKVLASYKDKSHGLGRMEVCGYGGFVAIDLKH